MAHPRVYADFQNLDDANRLRLNSQGTAADLAHLGIQLNEGLELTFYTDDADDDGRPDPLLVDGVVRHSDSEDCWVAEVNWAALRHESEEAALNMNGTRSTQRRAPSN
jgi:hypothetical protein